MSALSPWEPPATPARYLAGGAEEAERLLGELVLPPGELTEGRRLVYYVQHHPNLRGLAQSYLAGLLEDFSPEAIRPARATAASKSAEQDYARLLSRILTHALTQERRLGLVNLFWLSHSREIAETIEKIAEGNTLLGRVRFSIHPLLARFLHDCWATACREVEREHPGHLRLVLGSSLRQSLVDVIIDDQLPLVLADIDSLDFAELLSANTRYRLSHEIFSEIMSLLRAQIEERLGRADPLLLTKIRRHLPALEPESYTLPAQITKMLFNPELRRHLFSDAWRVGARLASSPRLSAELGRGVDPLSLLETFDELLCAVQRFELLCWGREKIRLVPAVMSEDEIHEQHGPIRLYRFSEAIEVAGNASDATVLFLDLREFTKTAEGAVSERDLTRELYAVFDPFCEIIQRFDGRVDKFLGDGMMVTFGAVHASPYAALSALRTAVALQAKLAELRACGRTHFSMGVSIHHGRVYLAHFLGSAAGPDTTVIGRNVNVAGRLSSASRREKEEIYTGEHPAAEALPELQLEPEAPTGSSLRVELDGAGGLVNQGIVLSREAVRAVEKIIPLHQDEEGDGFHAEFYDPGVNKRILIRYVGDLKFKGVRSSFPVYSADYR
jgi:class 3 adenylate cyclase